MPQLDPTWFASQLFWLAVCFAGLYFVMSRFFLPPLLEVMSRRQSTVEGDIALAVQMKEQSEHARHEYERTLADARERAQAVMNEAVEAHKAKSEAATKDMDRQIELKLADASRRITARKQEMIEALTPTMGELTSIIFEKLTRQRPDRDQVGRIVGELQKAGGKR